MISSAAFSLLTGGTAEAALLGATVPSAAYSSSRSVESVKAALSGQLFRAAAVTTTVFGAFSIHRGDRVVRVALRSLCVLWTAMPESGPDQGFEWSEAWAS